MSIKARPFWSELIAVRELSSSQSSIPPSTKRLFTLAYICGHSQLSMDDPSRSQANLPRSQANLPKSSQSTEVNSIYRSQLGTSGEKIIAYGQAKFMEFRLFNRKKSLSCFLWYSMYRSLTKEKKFL